MRIEEIDDPAAKLALYKASPTRRQRFPWLVVGLSIAIGTTVAMGIGILLALV